MVKLYNGGAYLVNGTEIVPESEGAKVNSLQERKQIKKRPEKAQSHMELWRRTILLPIWIT